MKFPGPTRQNRPFRPVPFNDRNTLKSGNQEPERRLTTAKRKSPHVFPDFRLVPSAVIFLVRVHMRLIRETPDAMKPHRIEICSTDGSQVVSENKYGEEG